MSLRVQMFAKRLADICISLVLIAASSPVLVVGAVLVLVTMGRPVLFRQSRLGYKGRSFNILKFRTMTGARGSTGSLLPDERRLTRFGRRLRSTSLDELPELLNVLRGDMSLVGPRPLLAQYAARYTPEQMRRHGMRPGMTGWAQVNGRNNLTWEQKFLLDVWYVDHFSLLLDLKIIALTFWMVLRREGINQSGKATAEEFMGAEDSRR